MPLRATVPDWQRPGGTPLRPAFRVRVSLSDSQLRLHSAGLAVAVTRQLSRHWHSGWPGSSLSQTGDLLLGWLTLGCVELGPGDVRAIGSG